LIDSARGLAPQRWRVVDTVVMSVRAGRMSALDAYRYDLLTRDPLVPTYANTITTPSVITQSLRNVGLDPRSWRSYSLVATTQPRSAAITLVLEGKSRAATLALGREVPVVASGVVALQGTPFELQPGEPPAAAQRVSTFGSNLVLPSAGLWLLAALVIGWRHLNRRHNRRVLASARARSLAARRKRPATRELERAR